MYRVRILRIGNVEFEEKCKLTRLCDLNSGGLKDLEYRLKHKVIFQVWKTLFKPNVKWKLDEILTMKFWREERPFITSCGSVFSHLGCIWTARVASYQTQRSFVLRLFVRSSYEQIVELSDVTGTFYQLGGFHFKVVWLESALVGRDFYRQSRKMGRNLAELWAHS